MQVAQTNISRLYLHQGSNYIYSSWQPVATTLNLSAANPIVPSPAGPKPLYYGNLFMANVLRGGNKRVEMLLNNTHLTTYAIYETDSAIDTVMGQDEHLTGVVIVNLDMWNGTTNGLLNSSSNSSRPETHVTLSDLPSTVDAGLKLYRLTSPLGATAKSEITFAGISVGDDGLISGPFVPEDVTVDDGGSGWSVQVVVAASEAVYLTFR